MRQTAFHDLRYAFRNLLRTPVFAAALLTLSLGIGANTAVFSAMDETLFRPLDFPHADQLADLFTFNKSTQTFLSTSYPDYQDFRARTQTFQTLSAFVRMSLNVKTPGLNQPLPVEAVTGNFFSMLQLPPVAGRMFQNQDDSAAAPPVALIAEDLAGPSAIGTKILIEDQPFTVIGIVPRNYHGTNLNWGDPPQIWIPLQSTEILLPRFRAIGFFHQRAMRDLLVTGRLKPGISIQAAQAEIRTLASTVAASAPSSNRDITAEVFLASRAKFWPSYRSSITRSLQAFAVAAGLVLLLTCANLANLLLGRSVTRRREFAIRLSLGATRARLLRQLLTENLLLVLPSSALALGISYELSRILAHFPNALGLPLSLDGGIDTRVLLFCLLLSLATTLLFGLAPALTATRTDVLPALKESGSTVSGVSQEWLQHLLIVLQTSFSMLLLVGGGLFAHSLIQAWSADFGFQPQGLLTAEFSIHPPQSPAAMQMRRAQNSLDRLRTIPGVRSFCLVSSAPFSAIKSQIQIQANGTKATVNVNTVSANFFPTLGLAMLNGRTFSQRDTAASLQVAIINQKLAARFWHGTNPVGRSLLVQGKPAQVIGIARDSIYGSFWEGPQPDLYLADSQSESPAAFLIARTIGNPAHLAPALAAAWNSLQPPSALNHFQTSTELLSTALAPQRMAAALFGAFGLLSVLIASVGLYSVTAFSVARSPREIGIRIAIGAPPSIVLRQILVRFMAIAAAGIAIGTLLSLFLARFLISQVKGISVYDTAAFVLAALLLGTVALLAAAIPARRAARIQPNLALRAN